VYLSAEIAQRLCLEPSGPLVKVTLASDSASTVSDGFVTSAIKLAGRAYSLDFMVVKGLCTDGIRGQRFMKRHRNVVFATGGLENDFVLGDSSACRVAASKTPTPRLFRNLQPSVKPVATKSRRFNADNQAFIKHEINYLLKNDITEPSSSPWQAQVLIVNDSRHKKRLVIDYSRTVNRFTLLDAYPLARIDDLINTIAKGRIFSALDLKSAYHQIHLHE